jgi:hypothetical protein
MVSMHRLSHSHSEDEYAVKSIPIKKKKKAKLSPEQFERFLKRTLADYDEETDARYEWALNFMKAQDESTHEAIHRLVNRMVEMAGPPSATVNTPEGSIRVNIEPMIQERNFIYIAIRLMIVAASMDIQIAKWKFPRRCTQPLCERKAA